MKITELLSEPESAVPASPGETPSAPEPVELVGGSSDAPQEPQYVTERTPSGIEIYYQWTPKRCYRVRLAKGTPDPDVYGPDWTEVPSVTTILGVLDKSGPLTWWGMKVGIEGVQALELQDVLPAGWWNLPVDQIVDLLTLHKLTVNHQKDKAADRGVNVHTVLEEWAKTGEYQSHKDFPEHEQGYVQALNAFIETIDRDAEVAGMELMVGSLEHQYAGRFDLILTLNKPVEVVTKAYPKKADKVETIPAGRYLLDLKTSKRVYDSHYLQLEAYEKASVECGYEPTDYRGVVHVTADGKYELAINTDWTFEDFQAVRNVYSVMNEREILRVLREELGAKEVVS